MRKVGKMIKEAFGDENVEVIVEECDCDFSQRALDNIEISLELERLVFKCPELVEVISGSHIVIPINDIDWLLNNIGSFLIWLIRDIKADKIPEKIIFKVVTGEPKRPRQYYVYDIEKRSLHLLTVNRTKH